MRLFELIVGRVHWESHEGVSWKCWIELNHDVNSFSTGYVNDQYSFELHFCVKTFLKSYAFIAHSLVLLGLILLLHVWNICNDSIASTL